MNNKKGFTLIELLVVVLILGILAAMAMPQYFKAVERSRMSEAESLLSSIASAQQRKYLQINKYAGEFTGLDVAPAGATGNTFHTKGANGNGFVITLNGTAYDAGGAIAKREANGSPTGTGLNYQYTLTRLYKQDITTCKGGNANGAALCADFCGVDSLAVGTACCNGGTASTCTEVAEAATGGSTGS